MRCCSICGNYLNISYISSSAMHYNYTTLCPLLVTCIKLIKSESKDMYNVTKDFHFKYCIYIILFFSIDKKKAVSTKILSSTTVLNNNNKKSLIVIINIAASSDYRGQAREEQEGRCRAERAKRQKTEYTWKKQIGSEVHKFKNEQKFRQEQT